MIHTSRLFFCAAAIALWLAPVSAVRANGDRVTVGSDNHIAKGEKLYHDAVAVMGSLYVDSDVPHDAVAVLGSNTVNGSTGHDVVAVMGDVAVNGPVGHDVVAVMGDVTLGPNARVEHDVVSVGGRVYKDPDAVVGGNIIEPVHFMHLHPGAPFSLLAMPFRTGRVLHFGHGAGGLWVFELAILAFYGLLALVFPRGVIRCGNVLSERPGLVIFTGLLTVMALPILFVVLLITVVGIPVAILALPISVISLLLFGKASVYGLIGRKISEDRLKPAVAVLLGGLLVVALCLVPIAGLMLSLLLSALGFSCAITALLTSVQRPAPAATVPPAAPPVAPPAPSAPREPPAFSAADTSALLPPTVAQPPPLAPPAPALSSHGASHISAVGLPRAGFWVRTWALLIDVILVAFIVAPFRQVVHVTHLMPGVSIDSPGMLPIVALYAALMWKLRGTTVGGIIFGLKVVRLDDRPIDWATALVRALGCFLSLVPVGLGFFWVAFDSEKQSWHDKIAGTVVVRVPKGVPLV